MKLLLLSLPTCCGSPKPSSICSSSLRDASCSHGHSCGPTAARGLLPADRRNLVLSGGDLASPCLPSPARDPIEEFLCVARALTVRTTFRLLLLITLRALGFCLTWAPPPGLAPHVTPTLAPQHFHPLPPACAGAHTGRAESSSVPVEHRATQGLLQRHREGRARAWPYSSPSPVSEGRRGNSSQGQSLHLPPSNKVPTCQPRGFLPLPLPSPYTPPLRQSL